VDPYTEEDLDTSFANFKEALRIFTDDSAGEHEVEVSRETARKALDAAFAEHQHVVANAYREAAKC
jgi:hypothetical protein